MITAGTAAATSLAVITTAMIMTAGIDMTMRTIALQEMDATKKMNALAVTTISPIKINMMMIAEGCAMVAMKTMMTTAPTDAADIKAIAMKITTRTSTMITMNQAAAVAIADMAAMGVQTAEEIPEDKILVATREE
jgi:hypothetical protein